MYSLKTITPLLRRVIVFLVIFVIISGISGPRIIDGDILFRDGFALYGGFGKALIFGIIAFALLIRRNTSTIALQAWHWNLLGWAVVSGIAFFVSWVAVSNLLNDQRSAMNLIAAHLGLLLSIVCAAIACLGSANIRALWDNYRREIINSILIAGAFYLFLTVVYALWNPLATVVLHSVKLLLDITGLSATIAPPHTLILDKFGITVAQYCSGIESIALFTGLYAIVGLLDWERLNKRRYFIVFPVALLFLFGLNIVRVYGLIIAGYYIDPQIAFSLFHTYAGLVFFILYSTIFWAIAYKHLLAKPKKEIAHEKETK